ncbi:MAG: zinc-dependent metalloprotease [Acidimicrobiia bacterium]|nr:zinc-dependent metalloprotease [Acidimicrobiia bacterium]
MTENLFDRLRELLESSGPVNWKLAREIAESSAGASEPIEPWVAEEYLELTRTAAQLVDRASPLDAVSGTAEARVVDRRRWAAENVEGFGFFAEPLAEKLGGGALSAPSSDPMAAMFSQLGPALVGMQMGTMAGFMSQRVLGQFDVGLPIGGPITFVAPNVEAFADDAGLDVRQVRLWVALHEVVHRAEFSLPWVEDHVAALMEDFADRLELDPQQLQERMGSLEDPESLQRMLEDPSGFTGLLAGDGHREALDAIQAFMAVTEGYAEWLVDRAAPGMVPDADAIRTAIDRRRAEPAEGEQMLQRILGLELQHDRYRSGTTFCAEVERRLGEETLSRMWEGPGMLPTLDELDDVVGWAARVTLDGFDE